MYPTPSQCPTCGHTLEVRELSCPECDTIVRGRWSAGPLSQLTAEQETFLLLFVRSRGNLSEVERSLGVSYPTVRAKLEEVIEALAAPAELPARPERPASPAPPPPPPAPASAPSPSPRDALLARIARGEIGVDEGLRRLNDLKEEQ